MGQIRLLTFDEFFQELKEEAVLEGRDGTLTAPKFYTAYADYVAAALRAEAADRIVQEKRHMDYLIPSDHVRLDALISNFFTISTESQRRETK